MSVKVINQKSITTRYKCIEQKKKKTNILSVLTTTANVYQPSPTTCGTLMIPQKTISKPIAVVAIMVDLWEFIGLYLCTEGLRRGELAEKALDTVVICRTPLRLLVRIV